VQIKEYAPVVAEAAKRPVFSEPMYYQGDEMLSLLLYIRQTRQLVLDPVTLRSVLEDPDEDQARDVPLPAGSALGEADWLHAWRLAWRANLLTQRSLQGGRRPVVPAFAPVSLFDLPECASAGFAQFRAAIRFGRPFGSRDGRLDDVTRLISDAGVRWVYVVPVEGDWSALIERDIFAISCEAFLDDERSRSILHDRFGA
jgi:hypothetical protein